MPDAVALVGLRDAFADMSGRGGVNNNFRPIKRATNISCGFENDDDDDEEA